MQSEPVNKTESVLRIATMSLLACVFGMDAFGDDIKAVSLESLSGKTYASSDTLDPPPGRSADAQECLDGLVWEPSEFEVRVREATVSDLLIQYPSPIVSGNERNDQVSMEWYVARDSNGDPVSARAVVVVHESGSAMTVGRLFARGLRLQGLHAFLLHLPYYGERRTAGKRPRDANVIEGMRQAIADVRRARDAVAVLPMVDASHIGLQGTSLGGFVSATTACLDGGYDSVFLMLAGGHLYELIENGEKDAAKVRDTLAKAGLVGEKLKKLAWKIEPTRLAHRLDPNRTWLYSASHDTVVPPKHANALAKAARLDHEHHIPMLANHYNGIIYLPKVLADIHKQVATLDVAAEDPIKSGQRRSE